MRKKQKGVSFGFFFFSKGKGVCLFFKKIQRGG